MALPKRVKVGGSYYRGYALTVSSSTGAYTLMITPTSSAFAANGMSITPTVFGNGDNFDLYHVSTTASAGGTIITTLAESVYNLGAGVSVSLDFATLELLRSGEALRFIYNNVASSAMSVFVIVETIK